jgi:hypothetical protein
MTMMAEGWKGLMWFVTGVAVALGLLLVPLQVAAARKQLDKTTGDVADAQRDIRSLETEFDTRSNLSQLEKWNGDTLGLASPQPGQFVQSAAQLASLDVTDPQPDQPGIRTAAFIVPTLPGVMPTTTHPIENTPASVVTNVETAAVKAAPATEPALRDAAPQLAQAAAQVRDAVATRGRGEAMAMLDRKLLSDSTLGSLLSEARVEATTR